MALGERIIREHATFIITDDRYVAKQMTKLAIAPPPPTEGRPSNLSFQLVRYRSITGVLRYECWERAVRKISYVLAGFALLTVGLGTANAQDKVKIGIILPYSGQFADTAAQMDNAIKLYVKQHGDTVAGKKIEFVRKDTGGIAPYIASGSRRN